ncbi:hypothetical protein CkP1_0020 [Citrobacter phage CkP1]|nr:hypothetical protein CkP1_0020 [Citrobacter phage CkP1]
MMKYDNAWLMNIPISTREKIEAKEYLAEKRNSLKSKKNVLEEKSPSEHSLSFSSYTSTQPNQSAFGVAADIAVFGFPLGVFR